MKPLPSVTRLNELFEYNRTSGLFRNKSGKIVGRIKNGYRCIWIDGKEYRASRLAYKLVHGCDPEIEVDHKNGNRADDSEDNLRSATRLQNARNVPLRKDNKAGLKGVCWHERTKRWRAQIGVDGRQRYLGAFKDPKAAYDAYCAAATQLHQEFARIS